MQVVFDRYASAGGAAYIDLATGERVRIVSMDVPDDDWRRRWRVRVEALLDGCDGIEPLVDAGDAGPHAIFEVVRDEDPRRVAPARDARGRARLSKALGWLESRGLCPGPCRESRRCADGRVRCDIRIAWPIETDGERRAASRQARAWRRIAGPRAVRREAGGAAPAIGHASMDALEEFDARAGLVDIAEPVGAALRYARQSGRVAISSALSPARVGRELLERRSFMVFSPRSTPGDPDADTAAWAAMLALESGRRHYAVSLDTRAVHVREEALSYGAGESPYRDSAATPVEPRQDDRSARGARALIARARDSLLRGRLAPASRDAARAMLLAGQRHDLRARAALLKARVRRYDGHPADAARLLEDALRQDARASTRDLLVEAAEAATDLAQLDRAEAYARAAIRLATTAAEQSRAREALDRACVWRGQPGERGHWQARAAWLTWGADPDWPGRGAYPHAPAGRLSHWEWACDRLERALWEDDGAVARRVARRLRLARLPPLLRARADWLAGCVSGDTNEAALRARRAGADGILRTGKARIVMEILEHLSSLLTMCQQPGDDAALLGEAASRTRQLLQAKAVAVFATGRALPVAGDGRGWNVESALAARCSAASHTCGPEPDGESVSAAAAIRTVNRPIGALAAVWPAQAVVDPRRARLLLEAAALALSPVLRAWAASANAPSSPDMPEMVGVSAGITGVRDAVRRVARVPFPVLIQGESGVGKELVARAIHRLSPRAARPFRALNCAAMAEELVEAELFGHAQGAYTGAVTARAGLFEDAHGGTLFLDEVSELSPRAQAKLLRVLQEGEVRRVGETVARRADVRIVAASNTALAPAVDARRFRADLLFRLDVLRVDVPPLRERPEDIPLLCAHFWREAAARTGTSAHLSAEVAGALTRWPWPGNVRELQNVIAALAVASPPRGRVDPGLLPSAMRGAAGPRLTLLQARAAFERDLVRGALARAGGRPGRAALELGLSRQGLSKLMRRLGMTA